MVRLVATDLDGTLLDPSGRIAPEDVDAVLAAADAGVRIVVATGRPLRWLDVLAPIAGADPLVIVSNGAGLYDLAGRRLLRAPRLEPAAGADLGADLGGVVDGLVFGLERGDVFGCEPAWPRADSDAPDTLVAPVGDLVDDLGAVLKLLALHPRVGSDDLARLACDAVAGRAVVTHSLTHDRFGLVELSAPGVTKARMLTQLCAELGIEPGDVVAFGDMPNDLAMLEFAGRAFVMANAHPGLRERFEVVGSNAHAGVGRTLRALLASD